MEVTAYRLVKQRHAGSAFDGEGARRYGGRWNSPGIPVVYTSESLALCCLEIFVHLPSYNLLQDYVYITVRFHTSLIQEAEVPEGWDARPVSNTSQATGDRWVQEGRTPILKVPSVIIPAGWNYLINVTHPDCKEITIGKPSPMVFDPRLQRSNNSQ